MAVRLLVWLLPRARAQLVCPYCDPNYVDIPGLEEACRGYDAPMGNPNPGSGRSDPGIRNQEPPRPRLYSDSNPVSPRSSPRCGRTMTAITKWTAAS